MQNKQKENEKGRILPIDEDNTQLFSSAVYEKGYTSEKMTSKLPYSGRSMIEMLGVLAIIGVLSVGGIAGYSKAMHRYRVNKTIEEITLVAGNVRTFFAPQKSYVGLGECKANEFANCNLYRKAKLVPEDMFGVYMGSSGPQQGYPENPFGGEFIIRPTDKNTSYDCHHDTVCSNQAFRIELRRIPQEACIDLITQDWNNTGVSMIEIINYENTLGFIESYIVPPVSIDHAVKLCEVPANDTSEVNYIYFYFDLDQGAYKTMIDQTMNKLNGN